MKATRALHVIVADEVDVHAALGQRLGERDRVVRIVAAGEKGDLHLRPTPHEGRYRNGRT